MSGLKSILGALAPTVATALGGPLGGYGCKDGSRQAGYLRCHSGGR